MFKTALRTISLLSFCGIAPDSIARSLTLQEALALTANKNPELVSYSLDPKIYSASIAQARQFGNPTLGLDVEDFGGTGRYSAGHRAETTARLGYSVEFGNKRARRVDFAESRQRLSEAEYALRSREIATETRVLFVSAVYARQRVADTQNILALARELDEIVDEHSQQGAATDVEKQVARSTVEAASIAYDAAAQEFAAARTRLAAQWGAVTPGFSDVDGDHLSAPGVPEFEVLLPLLKSHPRLRAYDAIANSRASRVELEKSRRIPDVSVTGGVRRLNAFADTAFVVGFSLPLPIFDANTGAIEAARLECEKTTFERQSAWSTLASALRVAYLRALAAKSEALRLEPLVTGSAETGKLTYAAYKAARVPLSEPVNSLKFLQELLDKRSNAYLRLRRALAEIDGLTARTAK